MAKILRCIINTESRKLATNFLLYFHAHFSPDLANVSERRNDFQTPISGSKRNFSSARLLYLELEPRASLHVRSA